jgi:hypothetical protein
MKAVLKAVLLDSEARRGDVPAQAQAGDGKFREPWLHRLGALRGLNCRENPPHPNGNLWRVGAQQVSRPDSVFGYYAPTDRAPGSNLLAPEQRLINSSELITRLSEWNYLRWNNTTMQNSLANYSAAGCSDAQMLVDAYRTSPKAFLDLLSLRYFRGAMPPTLRSTIQQLIASNPWWNNDPSEGAMRMLSYALATPYYGVMK